MSARSKIVRDFSGQEVAIPYDPRDDAQPEKNPNDHDRPHRFDVPGGMVGECLFWGCSERNPAEKPDSRDALILRLTGELAEARAVLREGAVSLENSLKRITLIDGGITDENEELYYAGIAALDNATDAFAGADRCTITATGRAALAAERAR